jgi:dihydroorotase-like cyclic amidohydrolase
VTDLAIHGATLVTPAGRRCAHVSVTQGRIAAVTDEPLPAREEIDAEGLLLLPGMVDGHVHFQEPGDTTREDFSTGSAAAAVGGITTVIEHTHSHPVRDVRELETKIAHLRGRSVVDFGLAAHVWPDRISEVSALWAAGATFFKVFTCTTHGVPGFDRAMLRELLLEVARAGALCLIHAEDDAICSANERALRSAGRSDGRVIPEWRSPEAELAALTTVAELVRETGARTAVAHVSHAAAIDLLARTRSGGARLWIETCPQYLLLREDEIESQGALRKFTPPARAHHQADLEAMWRRAAEGSITHVSTDHAEARPIDMGRAIRTAGRRDDPPAPHRRRHVRPPVPGAGRRAHVGDPRPAVRAAPAEGEPGRRRGRRPRARRSVRGARAPRPGRRL